MSHKLYRTKRWQQRRTKQLRSDPLCVMCKQLGKIVPASVADHITPHRGDEYLFWHGELQSLCAACHSRHKQRQEKSGVLKGNNADGFPLDINHHWHK